LSDFYREERRKKPRDKSKLSFRIKDRIYLRGRKVKESLDRLFGKTVNFKVNWKTG